VNLVPKVLDALAHGLHFVGGRMLLHRDNHGAPKIAPEKNQKTHSFEWAHFVSKRICECPLDA
jgi:hypothetical protein